ncbi:hypothetical protein STAFG_3939 [Streptomyces afghaniensis 772]|uniref:Uncharacterized protein n=1 Tax=Streptomyces afghaniensis 772 TaxID=1283301 RepID=S4MYI0_9ACTN|nr:hypothetical protein STAFG_3939 [Streptomyces afghaniensis 772]
MFLRSSAAARARAERIRKKLTAYRKPSEGIRA